MQTQISTPAGVTAISKATEIAIVRLIIVDPRRPTIFSRFREHLESVEITA